jgi:hypothetical protein
MSVSVEPEKSSNSIDSLTNVGEPAHHPQHEFSRNRHL